MRQEAAVLLGEVLQDRAGLEDDDTADMLVTIDERRDLPVGVHLEVAGAILFPVSNVDEVQVVRDLELGQKNGGLSPVRRVPRVEVQHSSTRCTIQAQERRRTCASTSSQSPALA